VGDDGVGGGGGARAAGVRPVRGGQGRVKRTGAGERRQRKRR
jgi:hypothetical protein